jgi:hypothetical protein
MSWTVACFCGHLFCGPGSSCPRGDTPVPVEIARPYPDRAYLKALIASVPEPEPRSLTAFLLSGGHIGDHALTVRPAAPHDAGAIRRLAVIAGRPLPTGHALLAEQDGAPVAAIALTTGALFADPLLPPKAAAHALRLYRYQLLRQGANVAPLWARRHRR